MAAVAYEVRAAAAGQWSSAGRDPVLGMAWRTGAYNPRIPLARKHKSGTPPTVKLAPETPEAREEAPRLIPEPDGIIPVLPDHKRYLALADEALKDQAAAPRKSRPRIARNNFGDR